MNNNSKLIEEYEAEITDILKKISSGLGKDVINNLQPKISELLEKITTITSLTNDKIEEEKQTINSLIEENSKIIVSNNKSNSDIILSKIEDVSNRVENIENNKMLETYLTEAKKNQQKINKLIYGLLFLLFTVLVLTITIVTKL